MMEKMADNRTVLEVKSMVSFRDAAAQDASLISHIYATSWRKAYRGLISQDYLDRLPDDYWVSSVRAWLSSDRFSGLIILDDKRPVGCAIYGRGRDEDHGDWGEIVSVYLLPDVTRRGLGTALMQETLRRMRDDGFTRFYLWAIDGNAAADAFYRGLGFKVTGDHINYSIGGQNVRDIRYVKVEDQT